VGVGFDGGENPESAPSLRETDLTGRPMDEQGRLGVTK
jgi:hypothetical protein